jgi:nucleoside-diphosphate kinase
MKKYVLIFVKQDGMERNLGMKILGHYQDKGFKLVGLKLHQITREEAVDHYNHHADKGFFDNLIKETTSMPLMFFVLERENAVEVARSLAGATDGSVPGTLRFMYSLNKGQNTFHCTGTAEEFAAEAKRFFNKKELYIPEEDKKIIFE